MTRWYMVPRERNDDVIEWVMVEPDMGVLAPEEVYFVSYVFFHLCLFSNVFFSPLNLRLKLIIRSLISQSQRSCEVIYSEN